ASSLKSITVPDALRSSPVVSVAPSVWMLTAADALKVNETTSISPAVSRSGAVLLGTATEVADAVPLPWYSPLGVAGDGGGGAGGGVGLPTVGRLLTVR